MQHPGLGPGIRIDVESVIIFPCDMQTPRNPHDGGGAVRLALLSGRLIFRGIPRICDATAFVIDGYAAETAEFPLGWGDHAEFPILGHNGNPVAGKIGRGVGSRRLSAAPLATLPALLRME